MRSLEAAKSSARLLNVISATSACGAPWTCGYEGIAVDLDGFDDFDFDDDFRGGKGLNIGFCKFWDANEPNSTA